MKRDEAIKWLNRIRNRQTGGRDDFDNARREAIDMAVSALENPAVHPCDLCKYRDEDIPEICAKCPAEV